MSHFLRVIILYRKIKQSEVIENGRGRKLFKIDWSKRIHFLSCKISVIKIPNIVFEN